MPDRPARLRVCSAIFLLLISVPACSRSREPRRNDVIVLRAGPAEELMIKRVVALGGDRVSIADGVLESEHYPDALRRVWSALTCPTSGDVLLSAEPAYEFPDWGKRAHVRGGSHGSLHRVDSLGALLFCGLERSQADDQGPWSLDDVAPMVLEHFDLR